MPLVKFKSSRIFRVNVYALILMICKRFAVHRIHEDLMMQKCAVTFKWVIFHNYLQSKRALSACYIIEFFIENS